MDFELFNRCYDRAENGTRGFLGARNRLRILSKLSDLLFVGCVCCFLLLVQNYVFSNCSTVATIGLKNGTRGFLGARNRLRILSKLSDLLFVGCVCCLFVVGAKILDAR